MIGRQTEVQPYLDTALEILAEKYADGLDTEEETEEAKTIYGEIVSATVAGSDMDGALRVLTAYHDLVPTDLPTIEILGNLNFDLGNTQEAIDWYDLYLDQAASSDPDDTYWRVKTDRAVMLLQMEQETEDPAYLDQAMSELELVTAEYPELWNAWFNLGQVHLRAGNEARAEEVWQKCVDTAANATERHQAETELAILRGEEPPAPPESTNPHGSGMGQPVDL
jgi:tetratricopeptide (TPR) repeat protein